MLRSDECIVRRVNNKGLSTSGDYIDASMACFWTRHARNTTGKDPHTLCFPIARSKLHTDNLFP